MVGCVSWTWIGSSLRTSNRSSSCKCLSIEQRFNIARMQPCGMCIRMHMPHNHTYLHAKVYKHMSANARIRVCRRRCMQTAHKHSYTDVEIRMHRHFTCPWVTYGCACVCVCGASTLKGTHPFEMSAGRITGRLRSLVTSPHRLHRMVDPAV